MTESTSPVLPPPLPLRAPKMLEQVAAARNLLADLEAATPQLQLAKAEMQVGANKAFADHETALAAARADLNAKIGTPEAAAELDRRAASSRVETLLNADPDDLFVGLSAVDCCDGCSETECMIGPGVGRCCHPNKGGLPPAFFNDHKLRALQQSARDEIAALLKGDDGDDDDEDDYVEDEDDTEEAA